MHDFATGIISNKILIIAFISWLTAQVLKVMINIFSYGKLDMTRLVGSGGMPSSHTALVMALSISVGRYIGWDSAYFAITAVFAGIVMHDAAGVRRATGQQAEVLNKIIMRIYRGEKIQPDKLKELIGHTPIEVLAGSILGLIFGLLL